jgi:hypothetical protein
VPDRDEWDEGGGEFSDSNIGSSLVRLQGLVGAILPLVSGRKFDKVLVVVTHPGKGC